MPGICLEMYAYAEAHHSFRAEAHFCETIYSLTAYVYADGDNAAGCHDAFLEERVFAVDIILHAECDAAIKLHVLAVDVGEENLHEDAAVMAALVLDVGVLGVVVGNLPSVV